MLGESRWMGRPATKPGYGDPEPLKPVHTCDPQENIDICLEHCPFPGDCHMDYPTCPLYEVPPGVKKRLTKAERRAQEEKVRDMVRAGWRHEAICQELGIGKSTLYEIKKRFRERGEIN